MADVKFAFDPISAGVGIGTTLYNEYSQQQAEKRAQRYYKQNSLLQYSLSRRAERESAMNQKQGLLNAGLSPALASEGKFSAPAVASAPAMPETRGQHLDPLSMSELMNQTLNRELIKQEIRSKDIENTRREDADATYDKNVRNTLDKILQNPNLSDEDRKWFEGMRENSHSYSLGSAEGLEKFVSLDTKIQTSKLEKNEASFKSDLLDFKRENGGIEAISKMDVAQLNSLVMHTAQARMQIMALAASIPKTEQEIRTLESQAMKNIAEANSVYHGDVAELWKQKDFSALVAHYVDVGISEGVGLLGLGAKAKVATKALEKTNELRGNLAKANAKFSHQSKMAQLKYKAELDDWRDARHFSRGSKFPRRSR